MEIKLSAGDKIQVPANCKATIKDNQIIIEEKQDEFKEGDILHSKATGTIAIFKEYKNEFSIDFYSHYHNQGNCSSTWKTSSFRHATEEEKQKFFDELNEKSLRWNEEIKKMEKIRKRVSYEDTYLHINQFLEVVETEDCITPHDDYNYNSGNYYLLEERGQAEADAQKIRAIFQERLK